ncbi:MAG: hypothetical protein MJZ78_07760 [Bacteroidales bacterium]|nr:hypothetical protein [Bacteroidales bacterium]
MNNVPTLIPFSDESNDYYCNKFIAEASEFYEDKMLELGTREELHASVPCVDLPEHLCYNPFSIKSDDGHRMYQFLIEYHTRRPSEGIYYGCRGITLKGHDHSEEIKQFRDDWRNVKAELCTVLNNTFPKKDFSHRFKMTDNANDQTYWLFWISLGEDEDIREVGVRAITIIRNVFGRYLKGEKFVSKNMPCKKLNDETAFTNECYDELVSKIRFSRSGNDVKTEISRMMFRRFMENAEKQKFITRNENYEKAWQTSLSNVEFARMLGALFVFLNDMKVEGREKKKIENKTPIPWSSIDKVFLNKDGLAFNGNILKTQLNTFYGDKDGSRKSFWEEKMKEMLAG